MIQSLIIEDEQPSARRLQRMLEKVEVRVIGTLSSVEEAVRWFSCHPQPDLIFLDIQLSDGISFEIFERVEISSAVIFTTAYDEYALRAFKLNSIDYLMKPIDQEELLTALQKYSRHRPPAHHQVALQNLKNLLRSTPSYKERFVVPVGQHLKVIGLDDISCFYSENKGTFIHTTAGRCYAIDHSLEKLEPELDPQLFFRVNRKFIVKRSDMEDILSYSNQRLEIKLRSYQEQPVIVSRERVKNFREWLT